MNKDSTVCIAIVCGGPSDERGISINSARSICDHLSESTARIKIIYVDRKLRAYVIAKEMLYSNTPDDFDHKLKATADKTCSVSDIPSLIGEDNLVFPAIHGEFGEDGTLQKILEDAGVEYVGSTSQVCQRAFDKLNARKHLKSLGEKTLDAVELVNIRDGIVKKNIEEFFERRSREIAVVKPARSGSSIGVSLAASPKDVVVHLERLISEGFDAAIVEPYRGGKEFTVVVVQSEHGKPIALAPIEIKFAAGELFDYRMKYLISDDIELFCPPENISAELTMEIRRGAERLFDGFGLRDFARIDGWVDDNGRVFFSDLNPISGMEQNSFLFLAAAHCGIDHRDLLLMLVNKACRRAGIPVLKRRESSTENSRQPVRVLFGGATSERQVSLLSGSNVWLKLLYSHKYFPMPYLLTQETAKKWKVTSVPYEYALFHSVEDVERQCVNHEAIQKLISPIRDEVQSELCVSSFSPESPNEFSLDQFVAERDYVFNALHGGFGENGGLQARLEENRCSFSGCESKASKILIDKVETVKRLNKLIREGRFSDGFVSTPKQATRLSSIVKAWNAEQCRSQWDSLTKQLGTDTFIVKPAADGSSTGVVRLNSPEELHLYCSGLQSKQNRFPPGSFRYHDTIEMPPEPPSRLVFEEFIDAARLTIDDEGKLNRIDPTWVEVTIGVLGSKGSVNAFRPSLTVSTGAVLTREEKFQQGTGVNLTPPPTEITPIKAIKRAVQSAEEIAKHFGLRSVARIDAFMKCETGELKVFEINTNPAMTPATVIFHQAVDEGLSPRELIEKIISDTSV